MASWSYAAELEKSREGDLSKKALKSEYEYVERVSKRTKARLQEYYDLYGYDPLGETINTFWFDGPPPGLSAAILAEAASFNEACLAEVDCDEWELEQRMRQKSFRPSWFLKWLFEHGMYVP